MDTGIGATLREAREAQSRSIEDVAASLRARVTQLRDLEAERFEAFGGDVYAKGFLKSYAAELGLDPAPLLDVYRREVNPEDAPPTPPLVGAMPRPRRQRSASPPAWAAWLLVAVIALAVVGFIGSLGPGTTPEVAGPDDEVDSSPPPPSDDEEADPTRDDDAGNDESEGNGDAPDTDDEGDGDATEDEVDEEPEPTEPEGVELLLEFEDRSWTRVEVDGTVVLEQIVEAGEILPFDGEDEILVRLGNAGGVRVQLNGEDLGAQGGSGDVVNVVFTPEGAETV